MKTIKTCNKCCNAEAEKNSKTCKKCKHGKKKSIINKLGFQIH